MSFEIGLREVYDKLVSLDEKWAEHWQTTRVELARMEVRLASLESKPQRSAPWVSIAISAIAVVAAVVGLFVK